MTNDQETKEYELEPVEIHEEFYSNNLFGEKIAGGETAKGNFGEKSNHAPAGTSEDFSEKFPRASFNIFTFTDAIGARNKREAWLLYHKALASGMVPEEVFYKLVWQVKTLILASRTSTASEADMKEYPYSKAKGFLKNFKEGELEKLSEDLVKGYHRVRRGEEETETFIEKTLLNL